MVVGGGGRVDRLVVGGRAGLLVGGGGLAVVGGLVAGTEARAKTVGKFGGLVDCLVVGAVEGGGVSRTARNFKPRRKRDLRPGRDSRKKRGKKEKRFFIIPPLESHAYLIAYFWAFGKGKKPRKKNGATLREKKIPRINRGIFCRSMRRY